jgi:hypothetical protein
MQTNEKQENSYKNERKTQKVQEGKSSFCLKFHQEK